MTSITKGCFSAIFAGLLSVTSVSAESQAVEFTSENWDFVAAAGVETIDGQQALRIGASDAENPFTFGLAILKGVALENGTIEYDVKFDEAVTFSGIQFRVAGPGDSEQFYMRAHHSGEPDANQYMPNFNGMPGWQLYYGEQYSAPTVYRFNEWMHVKLVVQGDLVDVFIDDQAKPQFTSELKRDPMMGGIALWGLDLGGPSWISNFSIDPDSTEAISGTPLAEPVATDETVMAWDVSTALDQKVFEGVSNLDDVDLGAVSYTSMQAEKTGLVNLGRLQGFAPGADTAIAKITISSESDQLVPFVYGYSDDAIVFLNGQAIAAGSHRFLSRDYRYLGTIGYNDTVYLPLIKGDNVLQIAVVTDAPELNGGWGVQGRFVSMDGISIK